MKAGDKVLFMPRVTSDLKFGAHALIGKRLTVSPGPCPLWIIQEEDDTLYTGEGAIQVEELSGWLPSGDLGSTP